MARLFDGAATTDRLDRAITAVDTGPWSMGCWLKFVAYATQRTILAAGTVNPIQQGLATGVSVAQRIRLAQNWSSAGTFVEIAGPATGSWFCVVGVYRDSATAASSDIFVGNLTTPMAAGAHVVDTNGTGTRTTGLTAGTIGKSSGASTGANTTIAMPFFVPWAVTLDEAERYRQGDWGIIFRGGTPRFFVPMLGGSAAAYDLAVPGNWTVTSTPTVVEDPPIAFGFPAAPRAVRLRA